MATVAAILVLARVKNGVTGAHNLFSVSLRRGDSVPELSTALA